MHVVTETPTLKAPAERFTGDVYLSPIQGPDAPARLNGGLAGVSGDHGCKVLSMLVNGSVLSDMSV